MLLVGAAGRNVGKTALVCALIEKFSRQRQVIGVKVTPVDAVRDACPRGGPGCGACDELSSDFELIEESARDPKKDTGRMLIAGAKSAVWVRARRAKLREAFAALAPSLPPHALCVCESTSLREVVEPGLFFIARRKASHEKKASAQRVWSHADRIVEFDGARFDLDLEDITIANERPALRRDATAVIMAGGLSSRMGRDKALMEIDGTPMIQRIADALKPHFREIIVSANDPERYAFLGLPVVPDREQGRGPLMGIASALEASSHDLNFVHACDMPGTDIDLMQRLLRAAEGFDAALGRSEGGRLEPLFAAYRKSALPVMREALASGEGRISSIFQRIATSCGEIASGASPANINTPEDFEAHLHERARLAAHVILQIGSPC